MTENALIEKISEDTYRIGWPDGKELVLIGTAHVSADSVKLVEETIRREKPDTIAVELDSHRLEMLRDRKKYEDTDIIQIIKKKKVLFFIAQLLMSAFQKKIARKLGVKPGAEFRQAIVLADELKSVLVLADRDINLTLKRLLRRLTFMDKARIMSALIFPDDTEKEISEEKIAEMKKADTLAVLIGEMGQAMPKVKQTLLDERDLYLAGKIQEGLGQKTVAVVGAAHVPGIMAALNQPVAAGKLKELEEIPPLSKLSRFLPWLFPLALLFFFIFGLASGNAAVTGRAALYWVLITGLLSALGCVLGLGHPLTLPAAFISAPITTLHPMIGVGMVTGLVQLFLVRPIVKDVENMGDDISSFKGWWKNRLTRALLVSLFSSLGAVIGNFIAFPIVLKLILPG